MREVIDEIWTLLLEERRIRVEDAKAREQEAKIRAEAAAEAKKDMKELRQTVAGIGKRTGDFMENTGRILERSVLERMRRNGGIGQVKGKVLGPLKKEGEYDAAVINGRQTVLVEVKRNLKLKDVREFLRRLPRFAAEFPDLAADRKVYGALAFELDADDGKAAELARENGLMLAQVSDHKGMKVLNPDPAQLRPLGG